MNENEFEFNGKTYVAVEDESPLCSGCAFFEYHCIRLQTFGKIPRCTVIDREDGRLVKFFEKEAQK